MFTGIITDQATIERIGPHADGVQTRFQLGFAPHEMPQEGASIACSGCCLTAYDIDVNGFSADLSPETLAKTSAAQW